MKAERIMDLAYSVATDGSGNIYVTGWFESSVITFGNITLTNVGFTDMFIAKLNSVTGIESFENEDGVSVYLSPARGKYAISTKEKEYSIIITDFLGEKIYSSQINSSQTAIDLSARPSRVYFLHLKTEQGTTPKESIRTTQKLIIQK